MKQIIRESDSNEQKVKAAIDAPAPEADSNPEPVTMQANVAGLVAPSEPTSGASVPQPPEGKRGRGRPRKDGSTASSVKRSHKKKTATDTADTVPDYIQAAALYNMCVVGGCKLLSDEFEQSDEMQSATIKAACDYFESIDVSLPAWAGLLAVTVMNIAAAARTEKAKGRISEAWSKVKAWYVLRKG